MVSGGDYAGYPETRPAPAGGGGGDELPVSATSATGPILHGCSLRSLLFSFFLLFTFFHALVGCGLFLSCAIHTQCFSPCKEVCSCDSRTTGQVSFRESKRRARRAKRGAEEEENYEQNDKNDSVSGPGEARPFLVLEAHASPVISVQFSPDGTVLASASHDGGFHFPPTVLHRNRSRTTVSIPLSKLSSQQSLSCMQARWRSGMQPTARNVVCFKATPAPR